MTILYLQQDEILSNSTLNKDDNDYIFWLNLGKIIGYKQCYHDLNPIEYDDNLTLHNKA